jgi:peroxiredoxin
MLQSKFSPGDPAPVVRLPDGEGSAHLVPVPGAQSTVLIFFRGNW